MSLLVVIGRVADVLPVKRRLPRKLIGDAMRRPGRA
jgi:hypothetical protein